MRIENMNISLNNVEKQNLGLSGLTEFLAQKNKASLAEFLSEISSDQEGSQEILTQVSSLIDSEISQNNQEILTQVSSLIDSEISQNNYVYKNHIPTCESMTWSDFITRLSLKGIPLDVLYAIELTIENDMTHTYYKTSTLSGHIIFSTIPTVGNNVITSRELDVNKSERTASIKIFKSNTSTAQTYTPNSSKNVTLYYNATEPY